MKQLNIQAIENTILNEGLYSNNLNDRGGETYMGISRKNWPNWNGWKIVDFHKRESKYFKQAMLENKNLKNEVIEFYIIHFANKLKISEILSKDIAMSFFDYGVNSGKKSAIKSVQKIVKTTVDGNFGPNSIRHLNNYIIKNPCHQFHLEFLKEKLKRYRNIVLKKPSQIKYIFGWVIRSFKEIESIVDIEKLNNYIEIKKIYNIFKISEIAKSSKAFRKSKINIENLLSLLNKIK